MAETDRFEFDGRVWGVERVMGVVPGVTLLLLLALALTLEEGMLVAEELWLG